MRSMALSRQLMLRQSLPLLRLTGTPQNRLRKKGNAEAARNPAAAESSIFIKADVAEILRSYLVMITDHCAWCMGGVFGATAWLRLTATYTRAKIMIRPASTAKGVIRRRTSTCFGCAKPVSSAMAVGFQILGKTISPPT